MQEESIISKYCRENDISERKYWKQVKEEQQEVLKYLQEKEEKETVAKYPELADAYRLIKERGVEDTLIGDIKLIVRGMKEGMKNIFRGIYKSK